MCSPLNYRKRCEEHSAFRPAHSKSTFCYSTHVAGEWFPFCFVLLAQPKRVNVCLPQCRQNIILPSSDRGGGGLKCLSGEIQIWNILHTSRWHLLEQDKASIYLIYLYCYYYWIKINFSGMTQKNHIIKECNGTYSAFDRLL